MDAVAPLSDTDFYSQLNQIAKRRAAVLAEIAQMPQRTESWFSAALQRCIDLILSAVGMFIGAIPFMAIAIAIKLDSRGPVFYCQTRVGKNGHLFEIVKFRTMRQDAESATGPVWASRLDPRLTYVGAFLREFRLDELPQLFNILAGEMTFVGPRPERPEFVYWFIQYMPAFERRHDVKPGIAGLAQLYNGYDTSPMSVYRKLRWDAVYIKKKSLTLDFIILYRTVMAVMSGRMM
jgi:lipopolysaccharide/colanic/teichoic acid biosynthesis glycosyltransferase